MGPWKLLLLGLALACSQARSAEAGKIADLPVDAATNQTVRLRGVVTFHDPAVGGTFVQDDTGAVELRPGTASIDAGQWLEIEGTLDHTTGRPVLEATRLTLVGEAPLPNPRPLANADPFDLHGQHVEISAVARSASPVPHTSYAQIPVELWGRRAIVVVQSSVVPPGITGSRILVHGVMVADEPPRILAHAMEVTSAPLPVLDITEAQNRESRLARAEGIVVYKVNRRHLFLENPHYAVEILTTEPVELHIGDRAEAIGFLRGPGLLLEDAAATRLESFETQPPTTVQEISPAYHGRLITLVGEVAAAKGNTLILSTENSLVPAHTTHGTPLPHPRSRVEITGMARTNAFGPTLWIRDSRDIRVLSKPPFWNATLLATLLGVATIILLAIFVRRSPNR